MMMTKERERARDGESPDGPEQRKREDTKVDREGTDKEEAGGSAVLQAAIRETASMSHSLTLAATGKAAVAGDEKARGGCTRAGKG